MCRYTHLIASAVGHMGIEQRTEFNPKVALRRDIREDGAQNAVCLEGRKGARGTEEESNGSGSFRG